MDKFKIIDDRDYTFKSKIIKDILYSGRHCSPGFWTTKHQEILFYKCNICKIDTNLHCKRCKGVWYCGKECQLFDWKYGIHKHYCNKNDKGVLL